MMIIVVEPYYRSLEAGMRTFKLAKELNIKHLYVASNKFTNEADENAIKEFCEKYTMPIISNIPYDSNLIEAERNEKAPYDYNIEAPSTKLLTKLQIGFLPIKTSKNILEFRPSSDWASQYKLLDNPEETLFRDIVFDDFLKYHRSTSICGLSVGFKILQKVLGTNKILIQTTMFLLGELF